MNKNIQALKAVARRKTVQITEGEVTVRGLGFMKIGELVVSYPAAEAMLVSGGTSVHQLIKDVPGFVIDAIQYALEDDTEEGREIVANLDPGNLLTITDAVLELTIPDGDPKAFMERLRAVVKKIAPSLDFEVAA